MAERQKHNGMSLFPNSSGSLAVICAADINNELSGWLISRDILFRLNIGDNRMPRDSLISTAEAEYITVQSGKQQIHKVQVSLCEKATGETLLDFSLLLHRLYA